MLLGTAALVVGQANGKLQIHFMDVGQGDGAVLISPRGEVVVIDNGVTERCDLPVTYLKALGVTKVDLHIASHYHADHIGCTQEILDIAPLLGDALDRGYQYSTVTYTRYVQAVGTHRTTATASTVVFLDAASSDPVRLAIVALNGNGIPTTDENSLSMVATIRFGSFAAVMGGDLTGYDDGGAVDVETSVARLVGRVDVYKVHHHGSKYSSNPAWLATVQPRIGILSVGESNPYGHPTAACLDRLHAAGVATYWTEKGAGVLPQPGRDTVGGTIVVQVAPGAAEYTVTHSGGVVDTYSTWEQPSPTPTPTPTATPTPTLTPTPTPTPPLSPPARVRRYLPRSGTP